MTPDQMKAEQRPVESPTPGSADWLRNLAYAAEALAKLMGSTDTEYVTGLRAAADAIEASQVRDALQTATIIDISKIVRSSGNDNEQLYANTVRAVMDLEAERDTLRAELAEQREVVERLKGELDLTQFEMDRLTSCLDIPALRARVAELEAKQTDLDGQVIDQSRRRQELEARVAAMTYAIKQAREAIGETIDAVSKQSDAMNNTMMLPAARREILIRTVGLHPNLTAALARIDAAINLETKENNT